MSMIEGTPAGDGSEKTAKRYANGRVAQFVSLIGADGEVGSGGGGGSTTDRELVTTTYRCKTAFSGASVGDVITLTQIMDVGGTPSTVSSVWRNQSTGADFGSAPSLANLEVLGAQGLTDAQFQVNFGAKADAVATDTGSAWSGISLLKGLLNRAVNYAQPSGTAITAATASPSTVADLTAGSFASFTGGYETVVAHLAGATGTFAYGFYADTGDGKLTAISGLPITGTIGGGQLASTTAAVGKWSLQGATMQTIYMVCTSLGTGSPTVRFATTGGLSRITALLRDGAGLAIKLGSNVMSLSIPITFATDDPVVGAKKRKLSTAVVCTATTYTTGQCIGGLITLTGAARAGVESGLLVAARLWSKVAAGVSFDIIVFSANPSGSTVTNASAVAIADADLDKIVSIIHITDYTAVNSTLQ